MSEEIRPTSLVTLVGFESPPPTGTINEYTAMTVPAFWRGVRFLAETLAGLPRAVYRRVGESRLKDQSHPVTRLLSRKINSVSRPFTVFETLYHHAIVWGNGYLFVQRDSSFAPIGLLNVNPEIVTPFVSDGAKWYWLDVGTSKIPEGVTAVEIEGRRGVVIPDTDMIHVAVLGFDGIRGYPLVQLMRTALSVGKAAERHAEKYFRSGSVMRGTIEVPGRLTDEQKAAMRESLRQFKGVDGNSAYDYMILEASAKLNNAVIPNETSQLIENRRFTVVEVAQMLGVNPIFLYDLGRATWGNSEQMGVEVVKYSLTSWIEKTEEELSAKLLAEEEQDAGAYVRINVDGLLRGDQASRTQNIVTLVNNGLVTPNWAAAVLDLPPLGPDGDKLRIPVAVSQPLENNEPASDQQQENDDGDAYSKREPLEIILPLVEEACDRVETKTRKAFANHAKLPPVELSAWAERFADEQRQYVASALEPIAESAAKLGVVIDVASIATSYAAEVQCLADTGAKRDLLQITKENIHA